MPIVYDSEQGTFRLDGASSSYIIKIYKEGYILNLYYGAICTGICADGIAPGYMCKLIVNKLIFLCSVDNFFCKTIEIAGKI